MALVAQEPFTLKVGDLLPDLRVVLRDADSVAVDLSGATGVEFHMRPMAGMSGPTIIRAAQVVDALAGLVLVSWSAGDTDVAGLYEAEFQVTWSGKPYTFPNDGNLTVQIKAAVG